MHRSKPLWYTCKSRREKSGSNTLVRLSSISGPARRHSHETTNSLPRTSTIEMLSHRRGIGDEFDGQRLREIVSQNSPSLPELSRNPASCRTLSGPVAPGPPYSRLAHPLAVASSATGQPDTRHTSDEPPAHARR